jgi:hypothetical protein
MKVKTNTMKDSLLMWVERLRDSIPAQLTLAGLIIGTGAGLMWYNYIYLGTQSVFDGMLSQSLQTSSYTRVDTSTNDQGVTQVVQNQVQFGPDTFVRRLTTVSQKDGEQTNLVRREALGTPKVDFERLLKVDIPSQPPEAVAAFKATEGKWVRMTPEGTTSNQYLVGSIFGIVPMAPLQPEQQRELSDFMKQENLYRIDKTVPIQKATVEGKAVYIYTVTVKTSSYLKYLQKFSEAVGIGDAAQFDPSQYDDQEDAQIEIAVSPRSRQVIEVKFPKNPERTEKYTSYGIMNKFIEPANATQNPQANPQQPGQPGQ